MPLIKDDNLHSFKETFGSFDDYLLNLLNSSGKLHQSDFDVKKVSGGFVNSQIFLLHDGLFKKTIATAFHIPDKEGIIHHFDIHLIRFTRKDSKSVWVSEPVKDIRNTEVDKLKEFISQQDKIAGIRLEKRYAKIVTADSPNALEDVQEILNKILKIDKESLGKLTDDGQAKLSEVLSKLLTSESILVDKKLYTQLREAKINTASIKKYEQDLEDFQKLIDIDSTSETDMQNFLSERVWFFGLSYQQSHRKSKSKFNSTLGTEYDFLLEGFNEVYDIAELKSPNALLIERHSEGKRENALNNRIDYRYSTKFSRALHQVLDYTHEFETFFERIKENQPSVKDFLYPKGIIVISKKALFPDDGKNSDKSLHLLNRQFNNIEILTYDDLATRGKIIVDFIKALKV